MAIKEDGTNTRSGAVVNGATFVKDESSKAWAVDDGDGFISLALPNGAFVHMSYQTASVVSDLLGSLVRKEFSESVVVEQDFALPVLTLA